MLKSELADTAVVTFENDSVRDGLSGSAALAAQQRRSVRSYTDQPVTEETVERLLSLTGRAPSAFNLQPWRFIVIRDAGTKAALSAAAYGQPQVANAPVVIALYADMEDTLANLGEVVHPGLPADKRADTIAMLERTYGGMSVADRGVWANAQSNIALGYLLLLAKADGLDSSPMLGFEAPKVKALLDIPETATITALVALGYGADQGFVSHRHDLHRITTFR